MKEVVLSCKHLDGTGGIQCLYQSPYKWDRGRPSLARACFGVAETRRGKEPNVPFLMCEPAELVFADRDDADTAHTHEWLVKEQKECSKYEERE